MGRAEAHRKRLQPDVREGRRPVCADADDSGECIEEEVHGTVGRLRTGAEGDGVRSVLRSGGPLPRVHATLEEESSTGEERVVPKARVGLAFAVVAILAWAATATASEKVDISVRGKTLTVEIYPSRG